MPPLNNSNHRRAPSTFASTSTRARFLPDPDLPNVEKAIFEAVEHVDLHREFAERDGPDVSDYVADLLVDALMEDLQVCRVRLAMDMVWAPKKLEAQAASESASRKRLQVGEGHREKATQKRRKAPPSNSSTISALVTTRGSQADDALVLKQTTAYGSTSGNAMKPPTRTSRKRARPFAPSQKLRLRPVETAASTPLAAAPAFNGAGNSRTRLDQRSVHENVNARCSKQCDESVEGEHQVTRTESVAVANGSRAEMETNRVSKRRLSANLPWWRSVESRMSLSMRHVKEGDVLRGYIMTLIRSCVRQSWKAEKLRESYDRDPSSVQGRAFLTVTSSLLMMERARHMGQCRMKWHAQLVQELLQRRDIEWSSIEPDPSFRQFVGCEVCLAHRPATKCLRLKGTKYDSRDFWPTSSVVNILSTTEDNGVLSLAVELAPGCRPGQPTRDDDDEIEFWVDEYCLRKCLVFHELAHSSSILTEDIMYMVEDELRDGIVDIPRAQELRATGASVLDVLESHLVNVLSLNENFMNRRIRHFVDILRLGEVYFSAGHAEMLDSCDRPKVGELPTISNVYDAPIELNDEQYRERVRKLESLTESKISGQPFPVFC